MIMGASGEQICLFCKSKSTIVNPTKVFPVPGGPWIIANSLVTACWSAFNWLLSIPKAADAGQVDGLFTTHVLLVPSLRRISYRVCGIKYEGGLMMFCDLTT